MTILYYTIFGIYTAALTYITLYCLLQFHLLFSYQRFHRKEGNKPYLKAVADENLPFVTIQLPIFNERYVVERLIEQIALQNYPKDRYEIHILDDSNDETVEITRKKVAEYKAKGFNIEQIFRKDRVGYKAGALKEGNKVAKGDFLAIFDADFMPDPEFLRTTIPYFENEKVGVVQTRWQHINEDYSLITKLQALQLNVHFTVEQTGRKASNVMLQFNGTAGVWRRQCIDDAGGWEADTLTEDLDLSIRAQLKGWEIQYLEKFGSPAELPAEMNGLKSQQFRWMKGGAETARKMLPTVWKSDLSFYKKIHTTGHLLASSIFVFVFLAGVFSVPLLYAIPALEIKPTFFTYFLVGWMSIIAIYYVANVQAELKPQSWAKKFFKFLVLFPLFLALSMGLSLHNTVAVIQGWIGKKSAFIRTPKFNIKGVADSWSKKSYLANKVTWTTVFEGVFALYFMAAVGLGFWMQNYTFIVFHMLLMIGYSTIFYYTLKHLRG